MHWTTAILIAVLLVFVGVGLKRTVLANKGGYIAAAVQANVKDAEWLKAKCPQARDTAKLMLFWLTQPDAVRTPQWKLDKCAEIAHDLLNQRHDLTDATVHRLRQIVGRADRIH